MDPLPPGITQVSNQGSVDGNAFSAVLTDDPAVGGGADPTVVAVGGVSVVEIPALGWWGLGLLAGLLAAAAARRLAT